MQTSDENHIEDGVTLNGPALTQEGDRVVVDVEGGAGADAPRTTNGSASAVDRIKKSTSGMLNRLAGSSGSSIVVPELSASMAALVQGFLESDQAKITEAEIARLHSGVGVGDMQDIVTEVESLRGHKKATWWTQFRILSGRAFKNLYR
jgi:hypothetical protein